MNYIVTTAHVLPTKECVSQSFLKELCQLLEVPEPEPTQPDEYQTVKENFGSSLFLKAGSDDDGVTALCYSGWPRCLPPTSPPPEIIAALDQFATIAVDKE